MQTLVLLFAVVAIICLLWQKTSTKISVSTFLILAISGIFYTLLLKLIGNTGLTNTYDTLFTAANISIILFLGTTLLLASKPPLEIRYLESKQKNLEISNVQTSSIAYTSVIKHIPHNYVHVGSVHLHTDQIMKMDAVIKAYLSAEKPFLKHGYTLKQLAEDTHIPLHHLSAFINQHYGVNFNDFINEYRVNFCKTKMLNDEWRYKKLEAIAEESGFNNRNTFTAAFKKSTGINPSDFLRTIKEKKSA